MSQSRHGHNNLRTSLYSKLYPRYQMEVCLIEEREVSIYSLGKKYRHPYYIQWCQLLLQQGPVYEVKVPTLDGSSTI